LGEIAVEVKSYAGHNSGERPLSFVRQGVRYEVQAIEKAWQEPGEKHFRIRTRDNKRFHLKNSEMNDQWSLIES
jgi:hypothetical protein